MDSLERRRRRAVPAASCEDAGVPLARLGTNPTRRWHLTRTESSPGDTMLTRGRGVGEWFGPAGRVVVGPGFSWPQEAPQAIRSFKDAPGCHRHRPNNVRSTTIGPEGAAPAGYARRPQVSTSAVTGAHGGASSPPRRVPSGVSIDVGAIPRLALSGDWQPGARSVAGGSNHVPGLDTDTDRRDRQVRLPNPTNGTLSRTGARGGWPAQQAVRHRLLRLSTPGHTCLDCLSHRLDKRPAGLEVHPDGDGSPSLYAAV